MGHRSLAPIREAAWEAQKVRRGAETRPDSNLPPAGIARSGFLPRVANDDLLPAPLVNPPFFIPLTPVSDSRRDRRAIR